jgi:beta-lactamase superfamily II metal-dependent hydrolase
MRRTARVLFLAVVCALPMVSSAQAPAGKTLDIYFIDTEGGQATLFVSPSGQNLLVDTGNRGERDLNRILEVLNTAGVKQIDHLFLTHYHGDHYGSLEDISKKLPVKHYYDHGPSIESDRAPVQAFEKIYAELYAKTPRTVVKPGDKIAFTGTDMTVVTANSEVLKAPMAKAPGAGRPNPACASFKERDESKVDPDNHYSGGFVMAFGQFRIVDLGDFTWNREFKLMCPNNPIGTVDLYLTSHHGLDQSGSAALVHGLQPRVAIMNNGTRKGGAVQTFQILESSPHLEDIWQLHWSYAGGVEHNAPGALIANIDAPNQIAAILTSATTPPEGAGGTAAHSPAHYIKVSARTDGSFTVTNSRNGFSKTYAR